MGYKSFLFTIPIFIAALLVAHVYVTNAYGITIGSNQTSYPMERYQLIGIQLSPTCLTLIKNHMPNSCPTYDKLKPLDNTNPLWEGVWVNDTYFHRELPRVNSHWLMNPNKIIVMVDPDPNFTILAKMIIIQPDNFTYINPGEGIGMNHTRNEYNNRFVAACSQATVAPILSLIEDTLHYIENDCKITAYNEKTTIKTGNLPFDYSNPYSSLLHDYFLKSLLHGHSFSGGNHTSGGYGPADCITHKCGIKDPYKKKGW